MNLLKEIRKWATVFVLAMISAGMLTVDDSSETRKEKTRREQG